jgi:hypothetical protein
MPGGASSSKQDAERPYFVWCTLCGKHQLDVEKLIHARPHIYVCIRCIDVMHATVHGYAPPDPPPPPGSLKERLARFHKSKQH